MTDLMRKIVNVAHQHEAQRVVGVRVRLGALSHMTPEHFGEHFELAAAGTLAQGAALECEVNADIDHPQAHDVWLVGVTVEE